MRDLGIKRIITSPVEHHAVLHTAELIARKYDVQLELVQLSENGAVDINHLEELLSSGSKSLVSLMHGNNEIGNLLDIKVVGEICRTDGALFAL
ncbi:MAG: aminotransferase class V-fold PLP-dependent enzyme [Owenweeksia sp.]|nr:aminotransferase class V-fold PLP-dependent enzyme [Owenweeksia sp.]